MRTVLILLAFGCSGPDGQIHATVDGGIDGQGTTALGTSPPSSAFEASAELTALVETSGRWFWSATIPRPSLGSANLEALGEVEEPPEIPFPPQYGLARTVRLARVTFFQSVGIDVARDGVGAAAESPLIAGRALRVRAYLDGGVGSSVLGRLRWRTGGTTTLFVWAMQVVVASDDANPESVFEFEVPKELVQEDASFAVDILEDGGDAFAGVNDARFPTDGSFVSARAEQTMRIDVRVVPMRYDFDGSMRTPDVSAAEIGALRDHIEAAFPVAEANVDVLASRSYGGRISPDDFDEHVDALHQVAAWRSGDAPPSNVYYLGLVSPEDSFASYCAGGCYAGVAPLNETNTAFQRVSLVVWYGAATSGWTALHEIGHNHGREHVACGGVSGADPSYPYAGGQIGVWGLDQRSQTFLPPSRHDFMSYCSDEWVSDYTYAALGARVRALRDAPPSPFIRSMAAPGVRHRMVTISERGARWSSLELPAGALGEPVELVAVGRDGNRHVVTAQRIMYSIDGPRSYVVPVEPAHRAFVIEGEEIAVPDNATGGVDETQVH